MNKIKDKIVNKVAIMLAANNGNKIPLHTEIIKSIELAQEGKLSVASFLGDDVSKKKASFRVAECDNNGMVLTSIKSEVTHTPPPTVLNIIKNTEYSAELADFFFGLRRTSNVNGYIKWYYYNKI